MKACSNEWWTESTVILATSEDEFAVSQTTKSTIIGLVDALGSGGGSVGGTDKWNLIFHLAAWKTHDGHLSIGKLRCELPVSESNLSALMSTVTAYKIVEMDVKEETAHRTMLLNSVALSGSSDPQLEKVREGLQRPVKVNARGFGELELDRRFGSYEGNAKWCGAEVVISLSCDNPTEPSAAISAATRLFEAQDEWNARVRQFAIDRLLPLKNETWLDEDEPELSPSDFASRMKLTTIEFDESGNFTFWHNDGDMFWGHAIQINGNLTNGLTDADIPG